MREILFTFLKLGITSFGGPIAHIGYFHSEFVIKKRWVEDAVFAELVAICQLLPGPASSQLGICIGSIRGGYFGGILAWIGFTLPSTIFLLCFAVVLKNDFVPYLGWISGLKLVAAAVVAHAVVLMWKNIATDAITTTLVFLSAMALIASQNIVFQFLIILLTGGFGFFFLSSETTPSNLRMSFPTLRSSGLLFLIVFFLLLALLPFLRVWDGGSLSAIADGFYRSGAFVFGGGHVVLPLLEKETVLGGWIDKETFLAGYGAAQAVPGPLFTFAAYLGYFMGGIPGAITAVFWIFLPSFLILFGVLPYWEKVRKRSKLQSAIRGLNAAVLGILISALYDPILVSSVHSVFDFWIVLIFFFSMILFRMPSWAIVIAGVCVGLWK